MSWSIKAAGTPAEIREVVRRHEHHHWQHMPSRERGMASSTVGEAIDQAEEHSPSGTFVLTASGWVNGSSSQIHVGMEELFSPPPVPDATGGAG